MVKKGLIITSKKDGQTRYLLSGPMIGFFEFTFMRTDESLPLKRLAELMRTYRNTPEFVKEFFAPGTSRSRALVYSHVLPQVKSEVFGFKRLRNISRWQGEGV